MRTRSPPAVTMTVAGPLRRDDLPALFARTCALLESAPRELRCEVSGVAADAVAVDALARLALAARRHDCRMLLCGAGDELLALVAFMGLADALVAEARPPGAAAARTAGRSSRYPGRR